MQVDREGRQSNQQTLMWSEALQKKRKEICRRVNPAPVVRDLISRDAITDDDMQDIYAERTQRKQADQLVDTLLKKKESTFREFVDVLRSKEVLLEDLAEELEGCAQGQDNLC